MYIRNHIYVSYEVKQSTMYTSYYLSNIIAIMLIREMLITQRVQDNQVYLSGWNK